MPVPRVPHHGHTQREPVPGSPAALRMILKTAAGIASPAAREKALADVAWSALEIDPDLACAAGINLIVEQWAQADAQAAGR